MDCSRHAGKVNIGLILGDVFDWLRCLSFTSLYTLVIRRHTDGVYPQPLIFRSGVKLRLLAGLHERAQGVGRVWFASCSSTL